MAAIFSFIVATISASGYLGVVLLMAIESACIPLPSEIIMPFAGYLVYTKQPTLTGHLTLLGVAIAGAIGCNAGSVVAYWIGALGGRPFIMRYGRFVLLNQRDLEHAERFFERRGAIAVVVGRLLPVVRTFIALPAGIARMSQVRFHVYTFLGSLPWCYALAFAGVKLGKAWDTDPRFKAIYHRYQLAIEVVIVAALIWFVWTHWKNRARPEGA
ncbi:MAG TPA: DedA family protein [Acidobacteriaceae bacterium]|nr:DedA family protein [Acidobacteriaceae bacterium]